MMPRQVKNNWKKLKNRKRSLDVLIRQELQKRGFTKSENCDFFSRGETHVFLQPFLRSIEIIRGRKDGPCNPYGLALLRAEGVVEMLPGSLIIDMENDKFIDLLFREIKKHEED